MITEDDYLDTSWMYDVDNNIIVNIDVHIMSSSYLTITYEKTGDVDYPYRLKDENKITRHIKSRLSARDCTALTLGADTISVITYGGLCIQILRCHWRHDFMKHYRGEHDREQFWEGALW